MNLSISEIKRELSRPLSEGDIIDALARYDIPIKTMSYTELKDYDSIDDLFEGYKYIALLYTDNPEEVGHWVLLIRHKDDEIELFDSYGIKPDNQLNFVSKKKNLFPYLTKILKDNNIHKLHYSIKRLQTMNDNIGTCGRHLIWRALTDHFGYTLPQHIKMLKENPYGKQYIDPFIYLLTADF